MWRLPPPAGVRSVRGGQEEPHHVPAEGAVRAGGGEASHGAPNSGGGRQERDLLPASNRVSPLKMNLCFAFQAPSKKKIEINTIASNYHLEVNARQGWTGVFSPARLRRFTYSVSSVMLETRTAWWSRSSSRPWPSLSRSSPARRGSSKVRVHTGRQRAAPPDCPSHSGCPLSGPADRGGPAH